MNTFATDGFTIGAKGKTIGPISIGSGAKTIVVDPRSDGFRPTAYANDTTADTIVSEAPAIDPKVITFATKGITFTTKASHFDL